MALVDFISPLVLTISRMCNLACPFCLSSSGEGRKNDKELTLEQWKVALSQFKRIGEARITGGETLHPYTYDKTIGLTKYLIERGTPVQINTNGTFSFNEDLDREMIHFQVSIDGNEEQHDEIRGKGVFQKAVAFIKDLKKRGYKAHIMSVIFKDDLKRVAYLKWLGKELGVETRFQIATSSGRGRSFEKDYATYQDMLKLHWKISHIGGNCRGVFMERCDSHISAGGTYFSIDEEGYIVPCPSLMQYKFSNILNWQEEEVIAEMKKAVSDKKISCYFPMPFEN